MKKLIVLLALCLAYGAFAQDAEDRQVMSLIQNKQYTHALNSPKGFLGAVLIFNRNGIAVLATKKDHLLGLTSKQVTVFDRTAKRSTSLQPDVINEQKFYSAIIVHDEKGVLGQPAVNVKGPSAVVRIDSRSPVAVRAISVNGGAVNGLVLGKVSLGAFSGKSNAGGTNGGDKYKLYKQFPLGALIIRSNDNPVAVAQNVNNPSYSDGVAFFRVEGARGELDLIINDSQTNNNKGEFSVMFQ